VSIELTLTLASPDQSVWELLGHVSRRLEPLGFRRSPNLYRAEYDPGRGVFDEVPDVEIVLSPTFAGRAPEGADGWTGWSTEFTGVDFSAYVLVAGAPERFTNCFVDITRTAVNELIKNRKANRFYSMLVAVAAACKAGGGFLQYQQAFEPIPPDQVVAAIKDIPQERGVPSLVGLIPRSAMSDADIAAFAAATFVVRGSMAGFWVLRNVDFETD
jgi:hypothetical protein